MDCDVCVLPFEEAVAVALPPPVEVELTEVPPAPLLLTLVLELPEPAGSAWSVAGGRAESDIRRTRRA